MFRTRHLLKYYVIDFVEHRRQILWDKVHLDWAWDKPRAGLIGSTLVDRRTGESEGESGRG